MDVTIPCPCPRKGDEVRHPDGDTVTLRDRLDSHSARAIRYDVKSLYANGQRASSGDVMAVLVEKCITKGIESWTLLDDHGKPVPVTEQTIADLVLSSPASDTLGDSAVDLYQVFVLDPLVAQVSDFSRPTPTDESTSAPKSSTSTEKSSGRSSMPQRPSRPSLISTSPMDDIETTSTSLVGVSSSSQSSESAA